MKYNKFIMDILCFDNYLYIHLYRIVLCSLNGDILLLFERACFSDDCFIHRTKRLSNRLLEKGYVKEHLKSSLKKCYGRYGDLIKQYEVPLSRMLNDIL